MLDEKLRNSVMSTFRDVDLINENLIVSSTDTSKLISELKYWKSSKPNDLSNEYLLFAND